MPRCQDPRVSPALLNKGLRADNVRAAVCAHPHRPGPLLLQLGGPHVSRWEWQGMGPSPEQGRQSRARPSCLTGPELWRQKDGSHGDRTGLRGSTVTRGSSRRSRCHHCAAARLRRARPYRESHRHLKSHGNVQGRSLISCDIVSPLLASTTSTGLSGLGRARGKSLVLVTVCGPLGVAR